ncbi:MAG: glycoside hydrolase family 13 protein, partial [Methanobacteriota archaeon]
KLSYLKQLGVTAIYFNPLFESPSLHKYDAAMYHHIDNNFGPNPKLDQIIWGREDPADPSSWQWTSADSLFLNLIKLCHENGIKVIIDGVFNHVGNNFWAFKDVIEHQEKSKYKDWFYIESWDDPSTTQSEFQYRGWYGVADLPELKEDENGLIKPIRDHIHAVVKRWMDPNGDGDPSDGIDGWRLDVADMVDIQFWKVFRSWVKEINPEAYLTGEIWWEDFNKNKMYNASPWLNTAFDGVMNYRVARAIKQFVIDRNNRISAPAFKDSIQTIFTQYPFENVLVSQNLMDSHDVDRIASQIVNPDRWYDHGANPFQNPEYQVRRPNTQEWSIFKLVVGLQMMLPGAPMIYYGDEAGMWGGDDPDCRKPMVWPELKYEPETHHPFGYPRPKDEVEFNTEIFNWYRKLISIRRSHPEISRGAITFPDDGSSIPGLLMFVRSFHSRRTLVILNNRPESLSIALNL